MTRRGRRPARTRAIDHEAEHTSTSARTEEEGERLSGRRGRWALLLMCSYGRDKCKGSEEEGFGPNGPFDLFFVVVQSGVVSLTQKKKLTCL